MSWSNKYLGIGFNDKFEGFDRDIDCWGLASLIYLRELNTKLDIYSDIKWHESDRIAKQINDEKNENKWLKVENPIDFDLVVLSKKQGANHLGIYIDGGYILHTSRKIKSQAVKINDLKLNGWQTIDFYRYND